MRDIFCQVHTQHFGIDFAMVTIQDGIVKAGPLR